MKEEIIEGYRLSPQQERLWGLLRSGALGSARAWCAVLVEGDLDGRALRGALELVGGRHEILRTTFRLLPEMTTPVQVIVPDFAPELTEHDWSGLDEAAQREALRALFAEAGRRPAEAAGDAALELSLVRLSPHRHVLTVGLSSLCADRAGLESLVREIGDAYGALLGGDEPHGEPMQYADLAEWQNELLESEETQDGREFWRQKSVPAGADLSLPLAGGTGSGFETLDTELSAADYEAIRSLAGRQGESVETFLAACWQLLLWRLSGRPRVVVGVAFDGRKYEELKGALGLFARHLPLEGEPAPGRSFAEHWINTALAAGEASRWQEFFTWEESGGQTGVEYFPFAFEFAPATPPLNAGGVSFSPLMLRADFERFDLKLICTERGDTLGLEFHHDAGLYARPEIERLAGQFHTMLTSALRDPEADVSRLEVLTEAERRQLLDGWNETAVEYPREKCLHQLVEEQVARTPERVAVTGHGGELTYRELNERANLLARRLIDCGVRPDARVGVLLERSSEMAVCLLGVLKAGGAYVPLEPEYPRERLSLMLEDARAAAVVTTRGLAGRLAPHAAPVVLVDDEPADESGAQNPETGVTSRNLAYVIYTSGSTGRPKGVMIEHRSINNRLLWMQREFPLLADDRVLQKTPFSFDASVWEFFVPLFAGARLVMARPGGQQDSQYLAEEVRDSGVTVLQLVPSMLQVVLDEPAFADCRSLRRLYCGGEALPVELQRRLEAKLDVELHNLYGPTETSIDAAHWLCERGDDRRVVPIGRPLQNTQLYILDPHGQPVPRGVAGELHIGGVNLARGYLNRPGLTAERFVPNPFGREGERLYRTGDLARHMPGGEIEFLGRLDHQVKVRGFRIELGEVEAALGAHPRVREAAVLARDFAPGEKRLVAYLVCRDEPPAEDELREHLKARLPEYMVPSSFVWLERMPLNQNGKLDRKALPEVEDPRAGGAATYQPPRTQVEDMLAGVWSEVLGLARLGVHDNFFELGGHSLLATRLMSRVRRSFGVELPLQALFEAPTVAGLAASVERGMQAGAGPAAPPLVPVGRDGELPLSFAQQRLWFLHQLEPESTLYNLTTLLRLRGRLDTRALEEAVNEVVRRHEVLRTTFANFEGRPRQVIAHELRLPLPITDLAGLGEEGRAAEVSRLVAEAGARPFDLERGPLLRLSLVRLGDEEHLALFVMHHIISDGWSRNVLLREITTLYEAFAAGGSSPLGELPVQYADYAAWQRDWLRGEVLEGQLAYWRERLSGAEALELPTDRPRPPVRSLRGATLPFTLAPEAAEGLRALARREGATLFMVLLAAFQVLLHRYSGQRDVVVGTPIAGRNRLETEGLIGFFVNMLAVRTEVSGAESFGELVARVREATLGAYAHQDVPFEKLVEELQPERDMSRQPFFQTVFTLQPAMEGGGELKGLKVSAEESGGGWAQFDLTLLMEEAEGGGVAAAFEYSTELFDEETVRRMSSAFTRLLARVVEEPSRRVSRLLPLNEDERRLTLGEWNRTGADYPRDRCVHQLFEDRAARTPERIALVAGDEEVSYVELNRRANRLAHHLRALGVGPEARVGLMVERSAEMVVSLLGILKAGAAYVPLDPEYPQERLAFMLADAGVELLLTRERYAGLAPQDSTRVVCLDRDAEEIAARGQDDPAAGARPENLAYVIYTSGSTGRPKGVQIPHRAAVNFLASMALAPGLAEDDVLLAVTSLSFDIAALELFLPLVRGARVVVAGREEASDARALLRLLSVRGATVMQATPTTWRMLIEAGWEAGDDLKVLCGGEALPPRLASELCRRSAQVWNMYGPTETTIWSTLSRVEPGASVNIGRPIANTQVYVLGDAFEPVAPGVRGELCIGGEGLARGYLRRPAATAERFVPDPFAAEPGARMYRTGDLARHLPDGRIEYLGRLDQQVKLHGHRIEPGEIETALAAHPSVSEALVTLKDTAPGEKRLVAYLVGRGGAADGELREFLKGRLPAYMLPAAYVWVESWPLTPNGKLDRKALPAPPRPGADSAREPVAPRDVVEEMVAAVWAELLGVERVGVEDSFFELGGHSLLATQLLSRLRQTFRVELPLRLLFQSPTVAGLARLLAEHEAAPGQTGKIARAMKKIKGMSPGDVREVLKGQKQAAEG